MNATPIFRVIGIIFVICFGISRCCKCESKGNWGCTHKEERNKNIIYVAKDPDFNIELYPSDTTNISDTTSLNPFDEKNRINTKNLNPVSADDIARDLGIPVFDEKDFNTGKIQADIDKKKAR